MKTTIDIDDGLLEPVRNEVRQRKTTRGAVLGEILLLGLLRAGEPRATTVNAPLLIAILRYLVSCAEWITFDRSFVRYPAMRGSCQLL